MPPVTHTITVKINNVDRSNLLLRDSLFVRSGISNSIDVAEFDLRDPAGAFTPEDWDEVEISVNGTEIFGGYIIQRDGDSIGAGSDKRPLWHVTCKDRSILLDRVIVNRRFWGTSDKGIISTLFGLYLSGEGFSVGDHTQQIRADIDINFEEVTFREALNELAARAGAKWHIGPDGKVYWYSIDTPADAPFDISQTPNNTTTFAPLESTLKRSVDSSQIINRVRVIGAEAASTVLQVDQWTANGSDDTFGPLTKKPHSIWLVEYTVDTGGGNLVNVSAYASQIGIAPGDALIADGGTYTVVADLENRTVKITDIDNAVPANGTTVAVKYYYTTPIEVTRDDTDSQTQFGRVFETSIYDENLADTAEAEAYGDQILAEYAFGRETISFEVTRHGLLPGQLIHVTSSTMGLDGDYLIQEVAFSAVAVSQDQFMVVASVQAGKFVNTLIETLQPSYSAGAGRIPARSRPGKISQIATDLGDVVAGRAIFTDGGTARFDWGKPGGATGIVIGLEDIESNAYGAQYIYESGTVRAKIGRLTGLPDIAGVTPSGWGIYTTNGYFSGQVVASQVIGGSVVGGKMVGGTIEGVALVGQTIEGAQITGGTVTSILLDSSWIQGGTIDMMAGSIGGFTVEGQHLWSNGGTISTGSVVNSSNPGVYMSEEGLFGFGTVGQTFGLWTDPAKAPWFSSGTINNVVYEVYESGVIRTGSAVFTDGGIQIDNSGIFGVNPITGAASLLLENGDKLLQENGNGIELYGVKFALDSTTGKLFAEDAYIQGEIHARSGKFTGTVESAYITGGTITGAQIAGQVISGSDLVGGTITGIPIADAGITNGSLDSSLILGGTMTAAQIVGGTITGGVFTGGNVSQGTIAAARINGGTVSGALISGGTFSGGTTSGGTISAARMNGGTISGGLVSGGTINSAYITGQTGGTSTFYLDTTGLHLNAAADARNIRWEQGGTIIASIFTQYSGGVVTTTETTGLGSTSLSHAKRTRVRFNDTTYSELYQTPASWSFRRGADPSWNTKFQIADTENVSYVKFRPDVSATNTELGDSTHAWRYLYLYDGTDEWRISISSTGQLLTTKV